MGRSEFKSQISNLKSQTRKSVFFLGLCLLAASSLRADGSETVCLILSGLGGMPEYAENFVAWAEKTEELCGRLDAEVHRLDGREVRRDEILELFRSVPSHPRETVWLFLIGHGNHDGERFKFNIKGPDLTGADLAAFLGSLGDARVHLIAATSASGALVSELEGEKRVVLAATRNRMERQPPLYYSFFVEAASSPEADSNKDGRVSLLEAFLVSRKQVAAWYEEKGRIQTEHAVLSDGGKQRLEAGKEDEEPDVSTGAGWLAASAFVSRPPERAYRSLEAQQLAGERARVERSIEDLKFRKGELSQSEYFGQLEELLVKLAEINERIETLEREP